MKFSGYIFEEKLYSGKHADVYRGRGPDARRVVLKVLAGAYPTQAAIRRLAWEYEVASGINHPNVVRMLALERREDRMAIVEEDCGGRALSEFIPSDGLGLRDFLEMAVKLADALIALHEADVIHKDIKPANIVTNPQNGALQLIDFGIATRLHRETPFAVSPDALDGTLIYMSPEQTGRINRSLDYRTDFYSLGVTFFEMLTGRPPFQIQDPMALIHRHIAKKPIPPHGLRPEIPDVLSDLIMKLMAKDAGERYQSAKGLRADLKRCLQEWEISGHIADFRLGSKDDPEKLRMPTHLYGRDKERRQLLEVFERVKAGHRMLLLIEGEPGIGKSTLVNELREPVTLSMGFFAAGKFDQMSRDVAYSALVQCLNALAGQWLAESKTHLRKRAEKIKAALGPGVGVLTQFVPRMALILGEQPDLPDLEPSQTRNRLERTMRTFIETVASPEHPLILFLDDLQWADSASLLLIEALLNHQSVSCFAIIGSIRPMEAKNETFLQGILEQISREDIPVSKLVLEPLGEAELLPMIQDVLGRRDGLTQDFCRVLHQKAGGNPFFTLTLFKRLSENQIVFFNRETGHWDVDLEALRVLEVSENVVSFLEQRLVNLPRRTVELLQMAACIGHFFSLELLEKASGLKTFELRAALQPALVEEIIFEVKNEGESGPQRSDISTQGESGAVMKFHHDRLQQAVTHLAKPKALAEFHWSIAEVLLAQRQNRGVAPGDIAHHLNGAKSVLDSSKRRQLLIDINLEAAHQMEHAAAFQTAFHFAQAALEYHRDEDWQLRYNRSYDLHFTAATCAYMCGCFEDAETYCQLLMEKANSPEEKAKLYAMRCDQLTSLGQLERAVLEALEGLRLLGFKVSAKPSKFAVLFQMARVLARLKTRKIGSLAQLPTLDNSRIHSVMKILMRLSAPAYLSGNRNLFALCTTMRVRLSLKHGNSPASLSAYATFGMILGNTFHRAKQGYAFGRLAQELTDRYDQPEMTARVYALLGSFVMCWHEPLDKLTHYFKKALDAGFISGDFRYTSIACIHMTLWNSQLSVQDAYEEGKRYLATIADAKHLDMSAIAMIMQQFRLNLMGKTKSPLSLSDEHYDEDKALVSMRKQGLASGIAGYHLVKMQIHFHVGDSRGALVYLQAVANQLEALSGTLFIAEFYLYAYLIAAAEYRNLQGETRRNLVRLMGKARKKISFWARHCPQNFGAIWRLVEAERARLEERPFDAFEKYDAALEIARKQGYLTQAGLAAELACNYFAVRGRTRMAGNFLKEAIYYYRRKGAVVWVERLEDRYGEWLRDIKDPLLSGSLNSSAQGIEKSQSGESSAGYSSALDLASVTKAAQTIASEIDLKRLQATMLEIILENMGATRTVLVLWDGNNEPFVAAEIDAASGKVGLEHIPLDDFNALPKSMFRFAVRTETIQIWPLEENAQGPYQKDPYLHQRLNHSVLCAPICFKDKIKGGLFLENNHGSGIFKKSRVDVLEALLAQAAISLENAQLYQEAKRAEAEVRQLNAVLEERVRQRTAELESAQQELVEKAHQAGMATIATSVLHNVGNLLNGVVTSAQIVREHLSQNPVAKLHRANKLLREHMDNLEDFVLKDPRGRKLLEFYLQLEKVAAEDQLVIVGHIDQLEGQVDGIREVLTAQQNFASGSQVEEPLSLPDLVADVLAMMEAELNHSGVSVVQRHGKVHPIMGVKLKVVFVVMSVVQNAVDAVRGQPESRCEVMIATEKSINGVRLWIRDQGCGIPQSKLEEIFNHGYSTKPGGQGYGLHDSANAMTEMGGRIWAESEGVGMGAKITLEFPLKAEDGDADSGGAAVSPEEGQPQ